MSPRARVLLATAFAAVLAAVGAVAVGALQGDRPGEVAEAAPAPKPRPGPPPLALDFGVRDDPEARALRAAAERYAAGDRAEAARLFAGHTSLEARVGRAFAEWPDGSLDRLTRLAGLHPRNAAVQLHLGIARVWADVGREREALQAAVDAEPDSAYAVTAGNLLHPEFAPGLPVFVPSTRPPASLSALAPSDQLAQLERAARGSVEAKLHYGSALQRLGRQRSAERVFAAAARQAPGNAEAQVAAAVGRFDKAAPARAFSRLGPLTRRFPEAATVRFHLGLLLLWSREVKEAKRQLERAQTVEPDSPLAREAGRYLAELRKAGV